MSVWSRIQLLLHMKTSAAIDRIEDPRETVAYAYEQQLEVLYRVRRGLVDVAAAGRRLKQQSERLRSRIPHLESQARRGLEEGREDLARLALERKHRALAEIEALDRQAAEVAEEERKLTVAAQRHAARVEEFRTHRDVLSARYTAAEAQVRVQETLTGTSDELAELSLALRRAEDKTEALVARASAIDLLVESGTLTLQAGEDEVERTLRERAVTRAVDEELAALKAQITHGEGKEGSHEG